MKRIGIYTLIIIGLFYFSEGKPCPEKTRPHKTRCDAFYKCTEMSARTHVWVPQKCEEGLIYEHNLKMCVLPEDDWECTLGDITMDKTSSSTISDTTSTNKPAELELRSQEADTIHIVSNAQGEEVTLTENAEDGNVEVVPIANMSSEEEENDDNQLEASGDGGELVELDGFLQAENRETEDVMSEKPIIEQDAEEPITKPPPTTSNIDAKLTAHLQRLSQLIDGLKQTYQNKDQEESELRPDQLNAFLAHFNIRSKFDALNPKGQPSFTKSQLSASTSLPTPGTLGVSSKLQLPSKNKTLLQQHLDPETKVMLANALPKHYGEAGYSNSQIVVNRPEGSVLFSLPYGNDPHRAEHHSAEYSQSSPKISEDTLKTVLELSKQMIATQSVPKVIPNPGYYAQPIFQPVFLPGNVYSGNNPQSAFSAYFTNNNQNTNNNHNGDYNDKYAKPSSSYNKPHGHNHRHRNGYNKPSTTIIHNNVIPVHVTGSGNSGEKDVVDSYGHTLNVYPPLQPEDHNGHHGYHEGNNYYTSVTVRPTVSTPRPNHYGGQYPPPYPTEQSSTTPHPYGYQATPSSLAEYFTASPHLDEDNANSLFQTANQYPTQQYGNIPRPLIPNHPNTGQNGYQQVERPHQQTNYFQQAELNSIFPSQIDVNKVKIRPNSQKFESMEIETDDMYNEQQGLSYDYNENSNPNPPMSQSVPGYSSSSNGHKHPYLPRPAPSSPSSSYSSPHGGNNYGPSPHKPKYPGHGYTNGMQLVNIGGNFISYDVFQKTLLPLLSHSPNELNNVEVITCATGVRQPNSTDCTRYYVCSKKDGKVLSYSCPPYTAFNAQSRICDAHTYAECTPEAIASSYTVSENKRIHLEALQEANRRRQQALKVQNIANLLQQYGSPTGDETGQDSNEQDMLQSYAQQAASSAYGGGTTTTTRPSLTPVKKRKYYCKEGDKVPSQTSIYSYFVCFKNALGMMKGHKMTCSKGLLFCANTRMCTLSSKCQ